MGKIQLYRCPEAEFWTAGDVIIIGKGDRSSIFVVVGRISPTVVSIRFKREMKGKSLWTLWKKPILLTVISL